MSDAGPWIERFVLGGLTVASTWIASRSTLRAKALEAQVQLATAHIAAHAKREDTTETHLLEAWKLERDIVSGERDALRKEREASQLEREAARLAREAEERYRRASAIDNELAIAATQQNADCQKNLAQVVARLEVVESAHSECPGKIAKLERDIKLLQYNQSIPPEKSE